MQPDAAGQQSAWRQELLNGWKALQAAGYGIAAGRDNGAAADDYQLFVPLSAAGLQPAAGKGSAQLPGGFIVLDVDFDAFIGESLKQFDLTTVALQLSDDSPSVEKRILYRSENFPEIYDPLQLSFRYPLAVASGIWTLQVSPTTEFLGQQYSWTVWGVLLAVMLFTTLLSIGLLILAGQAEQIRRKVEQRTAALHLANSKLQESETQFRELVQSQAAIVWRADPETWQFTFVSDEAESILGYPPRQWLDEHDFWVNHIYPGDRDWVVASCRRHIQQLQNQEMQYRMLAADGRVVWIRDVVNLVVKDNQVRELVGFINDITDQKAAEEQLRLAATTFESLQGIFITDRDGTILRVNKAFTDITGYSAEEVLGKKPDFLKSSRDRKYGAILFLDLDNFKVLNDSLGHQIGDELLIQVAIRLEVVLRQEDTPARLGGDEFVILVRGDADNTTAASDNALIIAEKLQKAINEPYILQDTEHYFTCSIGITLFPENGETPADLLQQADTAMYRSKSRGKNSISFFHRSMQEAADARLFLEVNAKLEKPVNFLANWRQNKGIRRGVSGAYLL